MAVQGWVAASVTFRSTNCLFGPFFRPPKPNEACCFIWSVPRTSYKPQFPPPPLWFVSSVLSQCVKHWVIVFLGHFDTDLNPQLWCQTRPERLNLVLKPIVSSVFYHSLHFWSDYMNKIVLHSKTIQRIVTERYLSLTLICGWTLNLRYECLCVLKWVSDSRGHILSSCLTLVISCI